jgi:hypothetical protein
MIGDEKTLFMDWPCGAHDLSHSDMLYFWSLCVEDYKEHKQKCLYTFEDAERPVPLRVFYM